MSKQNKMIYIFWILTAAGVGFLSGILSRTGIDAFSRDALQPPMSPPSFLFPVVWTILYTLMGISAARVYLASGENQNRNGLNLYVLQLIINFFWSPIFFNAGAYGFAFLWLLLLWVLVLMMILMFRKTDPLAAALQIPYLIWLTFALYLNWGVYYLNK